MFEPIKKDVRISLPVFKGMQINEIREMRVERKSQAEAAIRARILKHPREVYSLDSSAHPFKFRRDA